MPKNRKYKVFSFLIFSAVVFVTIMLIRPHSRLLLTLFPPAGLYDPLIKQSISLEKENVKYERELNALYVGTYFVGVYLNNPSSSVHVIDSSALLRISITVDNNEIYQQDLSRWTEYVGGERGKSDVILGYFKVPDDVPRNKLLKISLLIVKSDPEFDQKYGPLELFVQRKVDL